MLLGNHNEGKKIIYEKINSYEHVPIFIIRETTEMFDEVLPIQSHWHRSIEIIYTNQSEGILVINGERLLLPKNCVYVINSRDIHYLKKVDITKCYTGYAIQLDYSFLLQICELFDSKRFYIDENSNKYIMPILELIISFYLQDIVKNKNIITNLCHALIEALITYACTTDIKKTPTNNKKILEILDYIDVNYNQNLNIQNIADTFNISYTYLAKLCKENLGMSALQYINKVRYEKALVDIATTANTITDIAYSHGFPNVSALVREFKKNKKMLPSDYRKLIG